VALRLSWPEAPAMAHDPIIDQAWHDRVLAAMQAAGFRSTLPRRALIRWIAATSEPFHAETLVAAMEAQRGISSRATTYRLIDWLRINGWLARVLSDPTHPRYARREPGHVHHVVCTACGLTLPLHTCNVESLVEHALGGLEFTVQGHVLEIFGVCGSCVPPRTV
jgi:Fur family ferric uptake transcriptional regulator